MAEHALPPARAVILRPTFRRALRHLILLVGLVILGAYLVLAVAGPSLAPYGPKEVHPLDTFEQPSDAYRWGTDKFGRDIYSRVLHATRLDLTIALTVAGSAFTIGSLIGGLAGYAGGWSDEIIMRLTDILFSFPAFILAMAITAALGDTKENVIIAITTAYLPYFVRLTRGQMLTVRTLQYADAARAVGNPGWRVLLFHLLPNALTPSLIQMALVAGWAILDTAGLAFLGVGITPPEAEWGVMVSEGAQRIITGEWWTWLYPGLAILLAALSFNLVGDGLRRVGSGKER